MKPILAIMAHESAQSTVDDFLPKWNSLDCMKKMFIPKGHNIRGFQITVSDGENAYSGSKVFQRFLDVIDCLIKTDRDLFIIAEYDTVNLFPEIPKYKDGTIVSNFVMADPPEGIESGYQLCALSPWVMDRQTAWRFLEAGKEHLSKFGDCDHLKGLLDRWIGEVIATYGIPHVTGYDMIGYPWHPGILKRIKQTGANWIHGFKSKEEFGDLWN